MTAAGAPLRLKILARGGRVAAVEIESPRVDPSAVFIGRTPEAAAELAGRLFSLCPLAQAAAAKLAGGVADGDGSLGIKLLCERLADMLRANLLDWPAAPPPHDEVIALRGALQLLRRVATEPSPDFAGDLRELTIRLGLGGEQGLFARQKAEGAADEAFMNLRPRRSDYLTPMDDRAVVAAMIETKAFSRAPALPGRRVETGAAARRGLETGGLAARLAAREADVAEACTALIALLRGGAAPACLLSQGRIDGFGYGAVESARGRLYHACQLDGLGRIADYRIVAPTEWNFHPDGPFVRALLGAQIGGGDAAKRRAERLAFVYDPCIKAEAEILETADA